MVEVLSFTIKQNVTLSYSNSIAKNYCTKEFAHKNSISLQRYQSHKVLCLKI